MTKEFKPTDEQAKNILNSLIEDSNRYDQAQYEAAIDAFERALVVLALKYEPTDLEYVTEWFELIDRYIVPHKNLLDPETASRLGIEEWMQTNG